MGTTSLLALLLAQAALATGGLAILRRRVLPGVAIRASATLIEVWIPLAIVAPMVILAPRIGMRVQGLGWMPVAAPACLGVVAVGCVLVGCPASSPSVGPGWRPGWRLGLAAAGTGIVLLLIGSVNELWMWTGQCLFAIAAVLLWMNTPGAGATPAPAGSRGAVTAVFVLAAVGQGAVGLLVAREASAISAAIMFAYAAAATATTASAGARVALRVGGWAATLGTLLGIGALSLSHLAPQAMAVATGLTRAVRPGVAQGFGTYALEAMLLVLLPAGAWALPRATGGSRIAAGLALLAAIAVLAAWRLNAIWRLGGEPLPIL